MHLKQVYQSFPKSCTKKGLFEPLYKNLFNMSKTALAGAQDVTQNLPNQLVDFLGNMLRRLILKSYLVHQTVVCQFLPVIHGL